MTVTLSSVSSVAQSAPPPPSSPVPPPTKVGAYPTRVTATVRSLQLRKSSSGVGADLGEDTIGDKTFSVLQLRIHSCKALTAQGTPLKHKEAVTAISRGPIDKKWIGK